MKNKLVISLIIFILIIVLCFLYFYFQKPVLILKDDLSAEINTEHKVYDYIDSVKNGQIISKDSSVDTSKLGNKTVKVKMRNVVKRVFDYNVTILIKDTIPPVINCPQALSTTEGSEIDLLKDVKVVDNSNEEVAVSVIGEYDFNKAGTYNLMYASEDSSHNLSEVPFTLTVNKKVVVRNKQTYQFSTNIQAESGYPYYIKVNKKLNVVYVYGIENGTYSKLVKVFVCSAGVGTPTGIFKTLNKYDWRLMVGNSYAQYATRITGHYLFHSVPYSSMSKDSLLYHLYNRLGNNDSLGCVRLTVEDAKWIYDNCPLGTKVEIYSSDSLYGVQKPSAQKIDGNDPRRGWDPTDPDPRNPWKAS